jgi:hypothetical protein
MALQQAALVTVLRGRKGTLYPVYSLYQQAALQNFNFIQYKFPDFVENAML